LHPHPLAEPDVNLSIHPAPTVHPCELHQERIKSLLLSVSPQFPVFQHFPPGWPTIYKTEIVIGFPWFTFRNTEWLRHSPRLFPFQVDRFMRLNSAAPLLQFHYRPFIAHTGSSAPVPRIGTLTLAGPLLALLPLHRGDRFPSST